MGLRFNPFTGTLDNVGVEDLSRYVTLDQATPQTILNDTFKLDTLKNKTILGTNADGKIIEGTHQSLSGYVPYTGATQDVELGEYFLRAAGLYSSVSGFDEGYPETLNSVITNIMTNVDDPDEKMFLNLFNPSDNSLNFLCFEGAEITLENIVPDFSYVFYGNVTLLDIEETGEGGNFTCVSLATELANIETAYAQTAFGHTVAGDVLAGGSIWQKIGDSSTFIENSPANPGRAIDVYGDYLYLGTYQDKVNDTATVIIYDISDRLNPVRLSPTNISGLPQGAAGCKSVKYYDGYLYASWDAGDTNTLRIIDVSDPENPVVVAGSALDLGGAGGGSTVDVDTENDILYIACTNEVWKIDISDPTNPSILDSIDGLLSHGTLWCCKYMDGYVYTTGRSSADPVEPSEFYVIDVSDMSLVTQTEQLYFNGTWSIFAEDGYIYMANGLSFTNSDDNKFAIVDVSDPSTPTVVGGLFLTESPSSYVKKVGNLVYMSNWGLNDPGELNPNVFVINVEDPTNPYVVGQTEVGDMPLTLHPADDGQYLYIAFAPFGRETPFFGVIESKGIFAHYAAISRLNVGCESNIEYSFPEIDGSADQVLTTDGSGTVSWGNYFKLDQTTSSQEIITGSDTGLNFDEITVDLSALVPGLEIKAPILMGNASSSMPEVIDFPYAVGVYDRFAIFDYSDVDEVSILFAKTDFSHTGTLGADLSTGYFWVDWDFCPQGDDTYDLGKSDLRWLDGHFSGVVDSAGGFAVGGVGAVADGTYTVGIGTTTNGTITVTGGIITAVVEAS
jgi:hypothetical protein